MIIRCPHCQARLNLPGSVEGRQVRCPVCRQVFQADQKEHNESVQAGSPARPKPYGDEPPRPRTRRFEHEDDYDDRRRRRRGYDRHLDARDFFRDNRELIENAKSLARPAGYAMLAAFVLTTGMLIGYVAIDIGTQNLGLAQGPGHVAIVCLCHVVLYTPMLAFIGIGAWSLFALGSRGLIVTAIVMNFILLLILGCAWVLQIVLQGIPALDFLLGMTLAIDVPTNLANLIAAVMAIRVLTFREVAAAYAARAEEQWRGRY